ncbi:unnamed protein product [Ilex paraguariensis]|uniref:Uncharacterized protein n=1 Tax=Ilex paraguariensis TaxID=185542 RepID=A0ABC8R4N5_9AQUA
MGTYTLHVAVAALIGASFVAVSVYYMHLKALNQLLEVTKTIKRQKERDDTAAEDDSPQHFKKSGAAEKQRNHSRRKGNGYYRRASKPLPDVTAVSGDVEDGRNGTTHLDGIPAGLPRLHKLPEGMQMSDFSPE